MTEDVYLVPAFLISPVRVARDCYYYRESHTWVRVEGNQATVGISDLLRYRSEEGSVLEQKPVGTSLHQGNEFALWETIKAIMPLYSPVTGTIAENNRALRDKPDLPLQDPYGEGWIARLALNNWERDRPQLMTPEEYHALVKFEITGKKGVDNDRVARQTDRHRRGGADGRAAAGPSAGGRNPLEGADHRL